jgi:hypothetical protein
VKHEIFAVSKQCEVIRGWIIRSSSAPQHVTGQLVHHMSLDNWCTTTCYWTTGAPHVTGQLVHHTMSLDNWCTTPCPWTTGAPQHATGQLVHHNMSPDNW